MALVGVADLGAARAFYGGLLGLEIVSEDGFAIVARAGGMRVRLTLVPSVVACGYTVLGFEVPDAKDTATNLAAAGIIFERYGFLGDAQGPDGIWQAPGGTRVAWFKDPDGNLLSISDAAV
jgi:catechol 2,3-dioxygenase-like lactoylglutathione lyase family enzyme